MDAALPRCFRRALTWKPIHVTRPLLDVSRYQRHAISTATATHRQGRLLDESARFAYLEDIPLYQHEKPFNLLHPEAEQAVKQRTSNLAWKEQPPERITDMRGQEWTFELDKHGFALRNWPTVLSQRDFDEPDLIEHMYMPEIHNLFKATVPGADLVFVTHPQVRGSPRTFGVLSIYK